MTTLIGDVILAAAHADLLIERKAEQERVEAGEREARARQCDQDAEDTQHLAEWLSRNNVQAQVDGPEIALSDGYSLRATQSYARGALTNCVVVMGTCSLCGTQVASDAEKDLAGVARRIEHFIPNRYHLSGDDCHACTAAAIPVEPDPPTALESARENARMYASGVTAATRHDDAQKTWLGAIAWALIAIAEREAER